MKNWKRKTNRKTKKGFWKNLFGTFLIIAMYTTSSAQVLTLTTYHSTEFSLCTNSIQDTVQCTDWISGDFFIRFTATQVHIIDNKNIAFRTYDIIKNSSRYIDGHSILFKAQTYDKRVVTFYFNNFIDHYELEMVRDDSVMIYNIACIN
jgi:hypothetical protein